MYSPRPKRLVISETGVINVVDNVSVSLGGGRGAGLLDRGTDCNVSLMVGVYTENIFIIL